MVDLDRKALNFEYSNFSTMNDMASYPLNMWSAKPLGQSASSMVSQQQQQQQNNFAVPDLAQKQAPVTSSGVGPVKMKRGHVSKACTNCRKMHAGCDHARPCSRCVFHRMESTCMDVPRKKRISKKKKPEDGEGGSNNVEDQSPIQQASVSEKPKQQEPTPSISSTNEKIWKDTFNELFGELASPQMQFNPSLGYLQPLLFSELTAPNESDKTSSDLSNNSNEFRRDMRELVRDMDELRRSNVLLETKLNSVTQELVEMRQKMQQMLQLLGGFFMPQNMNMGQLSEF